MTKGAGMIHPNMATLLSVICTDAKVHSTALRYMLRTATFRSFNCVSIDGDTSTNDTVNLFANGAAAPEGQDTINVKLADDGKRGTRSILLADKYQSEDFIAFQRVLNEFMIDLAKLVVRDGEGATKFVTIRVEGARDDASAKEIANSIARSPLVKTALYGKDANWGRILCAIGYSSARKTVRPQNTSVSFVPADGSEELKLLVRGEPETVDEERAKTILEMEDLEILIKLADKDLGNLKIHSDTRPSNGSAVMWTCDFSHEYVTINGDYRT